MYNPKFLGDLSEKQQIFIFAHEVCHVAFEHIFRSEGKDKRLWKTATDSVINALLKQDGLPMVEGVVNIPEAINYDADEMYNKLLEKEKNKQEQQSWQGNQGQQNSQDNQEQQNSQGNQQDQNSQSQQEETTDIGHDTHSLWDKAIEDRKKEQQKEAEKKEQEQRQTKKKEKAEGKETEEKGASSSKDRSSEEIRAEKRTTKRTTKRAGTGSQERTGRTGRTDSGTDRNHEGFSGILSG